MAESNIDPAALCDEVGVGLSKDLAALLKKRFHEEYLLKLGDKGSDADIGYGIELIVNASIACMVEVLEDFIVATRKQGWRGVIDGASIHDSVSYLLKIMNARVSNRLNPDYKKESKLN